MSSVIKLKKRGVLPRDKTFQITAHLSNVKPVVLPVPRNRGEFIEMTCHLFYTICNLSLPAP